MDNGSITLSTDMYGVRLTGIMISILINQADIGHGLKMAGFGSPTMNGDGLHSTMVVGSTTHITAGSGFPIMSGHQHGWYGAVVATIMDGHR